jgi:hypothetical protein
MIGYTGQPVSVFYMVFIIMLRFSFMSGMAFRIATSKKLWKKDRRAILPHEILGTPVANALNKIRAASDADVFRRAPAMKLQQYAKETLAPFGLKPMLT